MRTGLLIIGTFLLFFQSFSQAIFKAENGKEGIRYNSSGEVLVEAQYDDIDIIGVTIPISYMHGNVSDVRYSLPQHDLSKKYAAVKLGENYGVINYLGEEILPLTCEYIRDDMSVDSILVYRTNEGTWSFIDLKTKKIVHTEFERIYEFYEGFAAVSVMGKVKNSSGFFEVKKGYINTSGELVIPAIYDQGDGFSGGIACVRKGDLYGYIDQTGKAITPCEYTFGRNFYKGYAVVRNGGKPVPNTYRTTGGKWGFIDTKGNLVTEMKFSHIGNQIDGNRIFVCIGSLYDKSLQCEAGGKYAVLDLTTGKEITDYFRADKIANASASKDTLKYFKVTIDKKVGIIDLNGNVIIPTEYTDVSSIKDGFFFARIGWENHKFTPKGEEVKMD